MTESVVTRRLHPATIVMSFLSAIRSLIVPLIVLLFSASGRGDNSLLYIGGVAALVASAAGLWKYLSVRYLVHSESFELRSGVLFKQVRRIPLEKIQDLQTKQNILQRMLGVVDVSIETAGGTGAEASLKVVSIAEYGRLREELTAWRAEETTVGAPADGAPPPLPEMPGKGQLAYAAPAVVLHEVSLGRLVLAGLTSNRMGPFLAVAAAGFGVFDDVVPDEQIYSFIKQVVLSHAPGEGMSSLGWVMVGTVIAAGVLVLAGVASVVGSVIQFHGFRLSESASGGKVTGVLRSYGLFTSVSSLLPRGKVQAVEVRQGLLRQVFGLASVHAVSAASGPGDDGQAKTTDIVTPICGLSEAFGLAGIVSPGVPHQPPPLLRVSRSLIGRYFKKLALLAAGLIVAACAVNQTLWPLWGLVVLPMLYAGAHTYWRRLGYLLADGRIWVKRGLLSREWTVAEASNAQVVTVTETPFDRRYSVQTVRIYLAAAGAFGTEMTVEALQRRLATTLAEGVAKAASGTVWETSAKA